MRRHPPHPYDWHLDKGFALIEVMLALSIGVGAFLTLSQWQIDQWRSVRLAKQRGELHALAQDHHECAPFAPRLLQWTQGWGLSPPISGADLWRMRAPILQTPSPPPTADPMDTLSADWLQRLQASLSSA
jgi:prepilin-type N-terminal cleavage/methylation domain-containing protein